MQSKPAIYGRFSAIEPFRALFRQTGDSDILSNRLRL
jgi:hypothetical protein